MPSDVAALAVIEKQAWLGPVESRLQKAVTRTYSAAGPVGQWVAIDDPDPVPYR